MPPPVEPAQPPTKLVSNNITGKKAGQRLKFAVVNPAVVPTEIAWKIAFLMEFSALKDSVANKIMKHKAAVRESKTK